MRKHLLTLFRLPSFLLLNLLALASWLTPVPGQAADKLKVGFIYVGPISDFGYTHAHDQGRLAAQKALPWVETSYVESVTDGDLESYIDQMVDAGVKVIFTTSTTFTDGTIASAARYPDVLFFNASGYKRAPNVAIYQADTYQCIYLEGLAAGAISKLGKVGSVSSYPTPEVIRIVDSFTLGLREVNPKAVVDIRWLNTWYDPPATKEAAESLITSGVDYLSSDMDSDTVAEVGESHNVPVNGPGAETYKAAPNALVTSAIYNWGDVYINILNKVHDGTYTSKNLQNQVLWFRMAENAAQIFYKPGVLVNPKYMAALNACKVSDGKGGQMSVYDLIQQRIKQMSAKPSQFEPFSGPLTDAAGKIRIPAGQVATTADLLGLNWRVPGIVGSWPGQ